MRPALSQVLALAIAAAGHGQQGPAAAQPLGQAASATIANAFTTAETWSLQAMALLSLGTDWHPAASPAVAAALQQKDLRLAIFAVEQLRRTDARVLASVCTGEVLEPLIGRFADHKNALVRERALGVLQAALPAVGAKDGKAWQRWWSERKEGFAAPAWTPAGEQPKAGGTVSGSLVDKAFDLRDAGLQVAFIVDSTGSMQVAIDAVRDAIAEISAILGGIAPKLELGLVHYKDFGDMGDAAQMLVPLSKDPKKVRDKLASLQAGGGGDIPERVEKGIEVALDKAMGWKKEANRLLLVIGDAPPHAETQGDLLALVKSAYEHPFRNPKRPTTGKQEKWKPFITSTVATNPQANPWFTEIATAGGGTNVLLDLSPQRGRGAPKAAPVSAPEQIAQHVLKLSFGEQFAAQIDLFVDTFFDYRRAGAF